MRSILWSCFILGVWLPLSACGSSELSTPKAVKPACNGHWELCERRFDEVAYLTTHNAMSSVETHYVAPNQHDGVPIQLENGVRGFMLDAHYLEDASADTRPYLCHGYCWAGKQLLTEGLAEYVAFLKANPREVITFIWESYISPEDMKKAYKESGLIAYVHVHTAGDEWPTLQRLIDNDERLITFSADGGAYPWYMNQDDFAWENPYAAEKPADLSCDLLRGDKKFQLWVFNHFLTAPLASAKLARQINFNPFFQNRVGECMQSTKDFPNFVTVDFYDEGDGLAVVDELNGVKSTKKPAE